MLTLAELQRLPLLQYDVADQLRDHIYARSRACYDRGDADRDAITTAAALTRRQKFIRKTFLKGIGDLPARNTPLKAKTVGKVECDAWTIEKVIFESRPKTPVTANLYLPHDLDAPRGAVMFVCGHHEQAKHAAEYQRVCQIIAKAGLIVMAMDPIGQGERVSYYEPEHDDNAVRWGTYEHDYAGVQCSMLGTSLTRYFLHDAMRGFDYLASRPEVDATRIGVTGNSGGGTQTSMMMLGDPRIAAAAPGTFIMNRHTYQLCGQAQDAEQIWPTLTAAGIDHEDILLACAPKPVNVLAVTYDFFPIEGTRRTVERCQRVWKMMKKPDNLQLTEDQSLHMYTKKLARSAAAFFAKHLLDTDVDTRRFDGDPLPPEQLYCFPNGRVQQDRPGARIVRDENASYLKQLRSAASQSSKTKRRQALTRYLKKRVFANRTPVDLNVRINDRYDPCGSLKAKSLWWFSQKELIGHGMLFRSIEHAGQTLPVTIAVWDDGTDKLDQHADWIMRTCNPAQPVHAADRLYTPAQAHNHERYRSTAKRLHRQGRAVLVLNVSGVGTLACRPPLFQARNEKAFYGVYHKLVDDLLWMDDDLACLRTYDVTRAIDALKEVPGVLNKNVHMYGYGRTGLYAHLAAAIDRRVEQLESFNVLPSWADLVQAKYYDPQDIKGQIVFGALKYGDLDDL